MADCRIGGGALTKKEPFDMILATLELLVLTLVNLSMNNIEMLGIYPSYGTKYPTLKIYQFCTEIMDF